MYRSWITYYNAIVIDTEKNNGLSIPHFHNQVSKELKLHSRERKISSWTTRQWIKIKRNEQCQQSLSASDRGTNSHESSECSTTLHHSFSNIRQQLSSSHPVSKSCESAEDTAGCHSNAKAESEAQFRSLPTRRPLMAVTRDRHLSLVSSNRYSLIRPAL